MWSNPLWEALEVDLHTKHEQIQARIQEILAAMPRLPSHSMDVHTGSKATIQLPFQVQPRVSAWLRWSHFLLRKAWVWLWFPLGL